MNTRLFTIYALVVVTIEALGIVAYYKLLPMLNLTPDFPLHGQAIALAAIGVMTVLGITVGYQELELDDLGGNLGLSVAAVFLFGGCGYLSDTHHYGSIVTIIAAVVAFGFGRLADYTIESVELNNYNLDLGRF